MGRIYKRTESGPFYGYWTDVRGIHHRQSLRTRDQAVARARLRELELAATNPAAYARTSLSAAITSLLEVVEQENASGTWRSYAQKARHLVRLFGDVELRTIDRERIVGYIQRRKREGAVNGTIHKELVVLRRTFGEALNRGLWTGNVDQLIPTIRVEYIPRSTWLTKHQAEQLLARLTPRRRLYVLLATLGGMCRGEIEALDWRHVRFADMKIDVPGTKREARRRTIPLPPELAYAMEPFRGKAGLVVGRWGNVVRDLAIACTKAKVPRVTPNDLRRTCASWMKNAGVDSAVVAAFLGNTARMIDTVYGKISQDTLVDAVTRASGLPVSDDCATGEKDTVAISAINETSDVARALAKRRQSKEKRVPRVGIEPTTRGFSVLREPWKVKRIVRR